MRESSFVAFVKYFFILSLFVCNSCLTLESVLTINENGSGIATFTYIVDKTMQDISVLGEEDDISPLNLDEDYIISVIGGREDISYRDYSREITERGTVISVTFDFDSLEALNAVLPEENASSIEQDGANFIYSQTIAESGVDNLNDKSRIIFEDVFGEHYVEMLVNTPSDIKEVVGGERLNSRQAIYSRRFIDIITTPEVMEWTIRW